MNKLLSESNEVSMMRLMSLLCVLVGCFIGIYGIVHDRDLSATAVLAGAFLGSAFGGKAVQKFAEVRNGRESNQQ